MKSTFLALSLMLASVSAFANNYPTIEIDGVNYYLADSNEAGDWFETMDGYCVRTGQGTYGSGMGTVDDVRPIVRLSASGEVVETYADYQNGNIWVVTSIDCE